MRERIWAPQLSTSSSSRYGVESSGIGTSVVENRKFIQSGPLIPNSTRSRNLSKNSTPNSQTRCATTPKIFMIIQHSESQISSSSCTSSITSLSCSCTALLYRTPVTVGFPRTCHTNSKQTPPVQLLKQQTRSQYL